VSGAVDVDVDVDADVDADVVVSASVSMVEAGGDQQDPTSSWQLGSA